MPAKRQEIAYHFRGEVERGAKYQWRYAYSETTPDGGVLYPWMTRLECQQAAARRGGIAVFYLDGRRMDASGKKLK